MKRIDQEKRRLILQLHERKVGRRKIAELVQASRPSVDRIIRAGTEQPVRSGRRSRVEQYRTQVEQLLVTCRGNVVRVREELAHAGIELPYNTLADFIRKCGLGKERKRVSGNYDFSPGEEMQHDTSAHKVTFVDGVRTCQCASLILHHSTMLYAQYYMRFSRLECRAFLCQAIEYFNGACRRCVVDNTHVVVLYGTGPDAVIVPEMAAFARHFGFKFMAHEVGDANRSAYVERYFSYLEGNFLAGRTFRDIADLNVQALEFCQRNNQSYKRSLKTSPVDLYGTERHAMVPLPLLIPPVYRVIWRTVDLEGYIHVGGNTYSVPYQLVGREVEVREGVDRVRVYVGPEEVASHARMATSAGERITDKAHRPPRGGQKRLASSPIPQEHSLRQTSPLLDRYVDALHTKHRGRAAWAIKRLHRMVHDYPLPPLLACVETALLYDMLDLSRLETMVLKSIGKDHFFNLEHTDNEHGGTQ